MKPIYPGVIIHKQVNKQSALLGEHAISTEFGRKPKMLVLALCAQITMKHLATLAHISYTIPNTNKS